MADIDIQTIEGYLEKIKWNFKVLNESSILTGIRCPIPFYYYALPIEIRVGSYWVTSRAFLRRGVPSSQHSAIQRFLSILNAQCHQVRFFMIEDCVIVQNDVPSVRCSINSFLESLEAIYRHGISAGLEIIVLSSNPSVAKLYETVDKHILSATASPSVLEDEQVIQFDITTNKLRD